MDLNLKQQLLLIFTLLLLSAPGYGQDSYPGVDDVPTGEIALRQIHPDVWLHISSWQFDNGMKYPSNGMIVRHGDELFLVDPAWGEQATEALLAAIEEQIGLPVTLALSTHFHDDRVAGDKQLEEAGIKVYATALTRRLASAAGNTVPESVLSGLDRAGDAVTVGPLEVFFPGAGHSRDNLIVYLPAAGILFGGCAVHEARRDDPGNTADADIMAWPASLRRIQDRYPQAKIVVPGHGLPGDMSLISHSINLLEQFDAGKTKR